MSYCATLAPTRLFVGSLVLFLFIQQIDCFPTINEQINLASQRNYVQNLDKTVFQPPQLEETIEEVQKILERDPTLPRLTRGEIEELYEKVTREEYQKSVLAGDMGRADSMRALMLVLPYNTDNSTEDNLQELYTRPPVTKVIDSYTPPQPIKFVTADPSSQPKSETPSIGNLAATTYKPFYPLRTANTAPNPTTYHPPPPAVMYKMTPSLHQFQPVTHTPLHFNYGTNYENEQTRKPVQRFSSHYNAKNAEFLKPLALRKSRPIAATVKPVADVLESLGIVGQTQSRHRYPIDEFFVAESAPKAVVSSFTPGTEVDFKSLQGQNLSPKIKPDAYTSFKPLNIGEEIRVKPEVEDYLTRFGIVGGRRRKALKKEGSKTVRSNEQISEESEISTAKVPGNKSKSKKDAPDVGSSELNKLLENLQELERLNVDPKVLSTTTTKRPKQSMKTTTSTTTTTPAPIQTTAQSLITNGAPMLIEPKKPRRRIDPNIDINYGSTGNHQSTASNEDQISKLLENLQELEKLQINPENVLKTVAPTLKAKTTTTTAKPKLTTPRASGIANRFSDFAIAQGPLLKSSSQQGDLQELQQILKELQAVEQAHAKYTSTTARTVSTPKRQGLLSSLGAGDLLQLQRLLGDERELERLYEQARRKKVATNTQTTSTSTTTRQPEVSLSELQQLQNYLAEFEKVQKTARRTTTIVPLTTTTSKPNLSTFDFNQFTNAAKENPKNSPQSLENKQLQELFNRVQQLEHQNQRKTENLKSAIPTTESISLASLGFTTRNVNAPKATAEDYKVPINDFAHLQSLYKQVENDAKLNDAQIEISTAATTGKTKHQIQNQQNLAQRIVGLTGSTSGNNIPDVDPNEFVQLQKLLSKVQELERVKINPNNINPTQNPKMKTQREVTMAPNLVTAASIQTQRVHNSNGIEVIYPEKSATYKESNIHDLKLDLPVYSTVTSAPTNPYRSYATDTGSSYSSSEEYRDLYFDPPVSKENGKMSATSEERIKYQQFFTSLEEAEKNSYKNMQPPMIQKTVTKQPPRFIATRRPEDVAKERRANGKETNLQELQKLLNNAQELEKLGVKLPQEFSQQIETKLVHNTEKKKVKLPSVTQMLSTFPTSTETTSSSEEIDQSEEQNLRTSTTSTSKIESTTHEVIEEVPQKTYVFSLTTMKSLLPKEPKTTTASPIDLPIFSATKIIEAAIKRAANRIGVSTEHPQGFRRRSDIDVMDESTGDEGVEDLMGEYSEMNYQVAIPEINYGLVQSAEAAEDLSKESAKLADKYSRVDHENIGKDLTELQRLIKNLKELQSLNVSVSKDLSQKQEDAQYFENLRKQQIGVEETNKLRRQSNIDISKATTDDLTTTTTESNSNLSTSTSNSPSIVFAVSDTTTAAPTRISLNLNLSDADTSSSTKSDAPTETTEDEATTTTTTEESRNGSLADLEASFGPDPNQDAPAPPKKKNGFYFLADWNSFLEVGDGDDQVVVRLSPKIGDPRLFLPVKVP